MLKRKAANWLITCLLGVVTVTVFGAACLHVAISGGPEWLAGHEIEIFLKFAAITVAAIIAEISWSASAIRDETRD